AHSGINCKMVWGRVLHVRQKHTLRPPSGKQGCNCRCNGGYVLCRCPIRKPQKGDPVGGCSKAPHSLDCLVLTHCPQSRRFDATGMGCSAIGNKDKPHLAARHHDLVGHTTAAQGLIVWVRRKNDCPAAPVRRSEPLKSAVQEA